MSVKNNPLSITQNIRILVIMGGTVTAEVLFLNFRTENFHHEKTILKFEFVCFLTIWRLTATLVVVPHR
jgi:hypothetical protein